MASWTHSICDDCWLIRAGPDAEPARVLEGHRGEVLCCFCGKTHESGIYVHEDPKLIACKCDQE